MTADQKDRLRKAFQQMSQKTEQFEAALLEAMGEIKLEFIGHMLMQTGVQVDVARALKERADYPASNNVLVMSLLTSYGIHKLVDILRERGELDKLIEDAR